MALNYSHRPIFPAHTSEDNLVSPLRIVNGYSVESMAGKGGDSIVKSRHGTGEMHDRFGYGRENIDMSSSPDPVAADVIDLLPSDPFGMDISTTFTTITWWLEDLEVDYTAYVTNNIQNINEDYGLFAGLNLIGNTAMRFQPFPCNGAPDDKGGSCYMIDECMTECQFRDIKGEDLIHPICCADDIMGFDHGSTGLATQDLVNDFDHSPNSLGGDPHEALMLALSYLGTRDLLSVECVSRSLCYTIRNDSLLWRSIQIDQPLNEKINDNILVQLTSRADGNLRCLSLINCPRITDNGLKRVLETNPKLTKLSIPGCTRLSIDGILNNLNAFKSGEGSSGIKHIRTGGFFGLTYENFKELKYLLGTGVNMPCSPRYYHGGNLYPPSDDERDIDVEECPKCQNLRLVYDCPAEGCQLKDQCGEVCRACILCIPRCAGCGRCVHNSEYEEIFSLEYLCSGCLQDQRRSQEMEVDVLE